ncbi:MAG: hypothetical protein KGV43_03855 [Arcobacter sp.]|nr:hypothetical protein [Arcobacter sp.]
MSFLESIKEFFIKAKETNFDLVQVYSSNPEGVYYVLGIVLFLLFIIAFLVSRAFKTANTIKLVNNIQNSKDFDEYDLKLAKLTKELPKRGLKVAQNINLRKEDILNKELELLKDFSIEDKISKYEQISSQYEQLAKNSQKYKIEELTAYYEEKSKTLLDENLKDEIEKYYENASFDENDVKAVNSIVEYANRKDKVGEIINPMLEQINSYSYGYNLELYKFIKSLSKEESKQVYIECNKQFDDLLESGNISEVILAYMLVNDEKDKVYEYIKNLKDKNHLQGLYNNLFGKMEDIDVDLAFMANDLEIDSNYADYLDNQITSNWKDLGFIDHVMNAPKVLETIGHISYRSILERIEKLQKDDEINKAVSQALETARRAESIAIEAKALVNQK